jgi:hypothetical protein
LARERAASSTTLVAVVGKTVKQEYCCRADAAAAAERVRALQSSYHRGEVEIEEHPV